MTKEEGGDMSETKYKDGDILHATVKGKSITIIVDSEMPKEWIASANSITGETTAINVETGQEIRTNWKIKEES